MFRMLSGTIFPLFRGTPNGYAHILGSEEYQNIEGMFLFYPYENGTVVVADIGGLPESGEAEAGKIFGFHIHEGSVCSGNEKDRFADAGAHLNLSMRDHPWHTGDMPVLFGNDGRAWMAFFTDRFTPDDVRGRTVIVHDMPDDFRTDPSGDSGKRIACGVIV